MKDELTELIEWFDKVAPQVAVNVRRCALCNPDFFSHSGRLDEYAVESLLCHYSAKHRLLLERNEFEVYKKLRRLHDLLFYRRIEAAKEAAAAEWHLNGELNG